MFPSFGSVASMRLIIFPNIILALILSNTLILQTSNFATSMFFCTAHVLVPYIIAGVSSILCTYPYTSSWFVYTLLKCPSSANVDPRYVNAVTFSKFSL